MFQLEEFKASGREQKNRKKAISCTCYHLKKQEVKQKRKRVKKGWKKKKFLIFFHSFLNFSMLSEQKKHVIPRVETY